MQKDTKLQKIVTTCACDLQNSTTKKLDSADRYLIDYCDRRIAETPEIKNGYYAKLKETLL